MTDDHFQDKNFKVHHIDGTDTEKWKRTLTEKEKQYRASILEREKKMLVSRINRKMGNINVLLYTHENDVTVKEELNVLQQLNDVFKLRWDQPGNDWVGWQLHWRHVVKWNRW